MIGVPFVVRAVVPALRGVDPRLRQAAAVLGARPWRVWRDVDLALAGRAVLVAAGFAFAISLGEFGATSVLARADTPDGHGDHRAAARRPRRCRVASGRRRP